MNAAAKILEPACLICVKIATSERERCAARRLRCAVFCDEQGIFDESDVDECDLMALPLVAVLQTIGEPDEVVGTVRIHEDRAGVWYGSRLAVARQVRHTGAIGSGLIRLAVGVAHAHGCHTFLAHVQSQNVPLFERLDWQSLSSTTLHGRPHHLMQAKLASYPPIFDGDTGLILTPRIT